MNQKILLTCSGLLLPALLPAAAADNWYAKPYIGLSQMSNLSADFADIDSLSGDADVELDSGFAGGLSVGYQYSERLALEFGWEYRSNDSAVTLAELSEFDDGNYASNIFYLNANYLFKSTGHWQAYAGAGLTWVEEVDIDLERGGVELSYSGSGDTGYQLFAGLNYRLNDDWQLQSELRYGRISGIDLDGESGDAGQFDSIEYETTTVQLGLVYAF